MSNNGQTALVERVFDPADRSITPEVARWIMELRADGELKSRVDELAERCNEGTITGEELSEYDLYVTIANVVTILQAKARAVLSGASRT
jgi:hypothetical protein